MDQVALDVLGHGDGQRHGRGAQDEPAPARLLDRGAYGALDVGGGADLEQALLDVPDQGDVVAHDLPGLAQVHVAVGRRFQRVGGVDAHAHERFQRPPHPAVRVHAHDAAVLVDEIDEHAVVGGHEAVEVVGAEVRRGGELGSVDAVERDRPVRQQVRQVIDDRLLEPVEHLVDQVPVVHEHHEEPGEPERLDGRAEGV